MMTKMKTIESQLAKQFLLLESVSLQRKNSQLLSKMAPLFGKDLCEQFVALEILSLCEDPQIRVRKEAVAQLPVIGKVVSPPFFKQRFISCFLRLSDDGFWGVRKACVDCIVELAAVSESETKEHQLTEIYVKLLRDTSRWVKISAYKNLGPFIATLHGQQIQEKLVEHYCQMTDNSINSLSNENEIILACSYNFPAVLQTLGPARWNVLGKTFSQLLKSNEKVKRPLACSLHEIARILGPDRAERELTSLLETFLRDNNDDIKYGAIKNLANFLKVFDLEKREHYVEIFVQLQKDQKKWRIRELIARQIHILAEIFSKETIFRMILPISIKLCNDIVSIVREEASKQIYSLVLSLYDSEEGYRETAVETVRLLSNSTKFSQRQAFVFMCKNLMNYKEIFEKHFLDCFAGLKNDRVPNVRITIAKVLHSHLTKNDNTRLTNLERSESLWVPLTWRNSLLAMFPTSLIPLHQSLLTPSRPVPLLEDLTRSPLSPKRTRNPRWKSRKMRS
eukprot:TRINITY_DN2109_c0_g1_i3.p1 TRINITY_DN2109_c0_g1~~TRINITY_DN2109_c0_g1_i3.p1  ORF type:complete len:508 (-),score=98.30 TRINITY_DN2109_c0_g1_i3:695-2218(-)